MKTGISIAVFTLLCVRLCPAQFGHVYGYSGSDLGYAVELTQDGGFVVGGRTNSIGAGDLDYWVVKFDKSGMRQWDKTFGTARYDNLWSIRTTRDNGFLLAGFSGVQFSGTESALMYKVDSAGNQVWKKEIDYPKADHAHWLAATRDGGYYFAGHTDSKGDPNGDFWVGKLDSARNLIWEKTFDNGGSEHAHAATITNDNGIVLLGHRSINGYEKFWAVRIDSLGNQVWSKTFSSSSTMHDSPYFIQNTRSGGFALFGGNSNNAGTAGTMWLVVIDSAGNKKFDKKFGSGDSFAWSGRQTSDGGFVLAGYTNVGVPGAYGMYMVKTDSLGNEQWEKTYGGPASDFGFAVAQHGSNYIIVGATTSFTIGGNNDLWVVYTDAQGNVIDSLTQSSGNAVNQVSPLNKATGITANTFLTWDDFAGATTYQVQVSTDSTFTTTAVNQSGVQFPSYPVNGLTRGATYYWRVRAYTGSAPGLWSRVWYFRVVLPAPGMVTLLSPVDSAAMTNTTVAFRWSVSAPSITNYDFAFADNAQFVSGTRDSTLIDTTTTFSQLATGSYYWHVRAKNEAGWGPYGMTRHFSVTPSGVVETGEISPSHAFLESLYPNPFREQAMVRFFLPARARVSLSLVNVLGVEVAAMENGECLPGENTVALTTSFFKGRLATGAYVLVMRISGGERMTMPVMLW